MSSDAEEEEIERMPEQQGMFSYFDHSHDQDLYTREYQKKQYDQMKKTNKTWHKEFKDGIVQGFLVDFKQRSNYVNNPDRTYTIENGLELYVNTIAEPIQKYHFFIPFSPYFYIIVKPEHVKTVLSDLQIYNGVQCDPKEDGCDFRANSSFKLDKTQGVQNVELVRKHVFTGKHGHFKCHRIAIKVILRNAGYNNYELKQYVDHFQKQYRLYFTYEKGSGIQYGLYEYDVNYVHQAGLNLKLRVGKVYTFQVRNGKVSRNYQTKKLEYKAHPEIQKLPKLKSLVFDIETRKKPVIDVQPSDQIDLLGVKCDGKGYLFNNVELTHFEFPNFVLGVDNKNKQMVGFNNWKSVVRLFSNDEVSQKWKHAPLSVTTIQCANERDLLDKYLKFIDKEQPDFIAGFNSDQFDWRHIENRCQAYGMTIETLFDVEIVSKRMWDSNVKVMCYKRDGVMMCDAMDWMIRDSYMSKGNQGLKTSAYHLLKIIAMEVNHEYVVQMWLDIQNRLLNPEHEDNKDPSKFEENVKTAFDLAYKMAQYNISDVLITDIYVINTIINLNIALASLIPMTVFYVSRRPRGEQCELKLMERCFEWGIIGNKISQKVVSEINPQHIKKERKQDITILYKKDIEGQKETMEAVCASKEDMKTHCTSCKDYKCKEKWEKIWNMTCEHQTRITCSRDSPEDEPENELSFFPLNNDTYPVEDEGFQGAKVGIYNTGFYTKIASQKFKIHKSKLLEFKEKFKHSVEKQIASLEKKAFTYKDRKVKYQIKDREGLINSIVQKFDDIIKEGKPTENTDIIIWEGVPIIIHVDVASMYPSIIINWNLQPYGIVTEEEDCKDCPSRYNESKGEPCCWFEHEWYAKYSVVHLSSALKRKVDQNISRIEQTQGVTLSDSVKLEMYQKELANYKGKRRKMLDYIVPIVSRVCQKAFKFFSYAVKSFREERLFYKDTVKKCDREIALLKSQYKNQAIPVEIQQQIDDLDNRSVFARNMQLALKVLLNSVHEDEQVLIQNPSGSVKYWKCKDFWNYIKINHKIENIDSRKGIRCSEYKIWNGNAFVPIRGVIQHPFSEKLYKIRTNSGREVRVTAGHSLTTIDSNFNIVKKKGSEFITDTPVIIPTQKVDLPEITEINIAKKLLENAPQSELENIRIQFDQKYTLAELKSIQRVLTFSETNTTIMASYITGSVRTNSKVLNILSQWGIINIINGIQTNYKTYVPNEKTNQFYYALNTIIQASYYSKAQKKRYIPVLKTNPNIIDIIALIGKNIKIGTEYGNYINNTIPINSDIASWCGFYMAEGTARKVTELNNNGSFYTVSYSNTQLAYLDKIDMISDKIFNSTITRTLREDKVGISTVNTKIAALVVWYVFGLGINSYDKNVPDFIFRSNDDIKTAFLDWYWKGDGSLVWKRENHVSFRTVSEYIVNGVITILNQMGYTNTTIGHEKTSGMYTIRINGMNPITDIEEKRSKRGFDSVIPTFLLTEIPEVSSLIKEVKNIDIVTLIPVLEQATSVAGQNLYRLLQSGIRFDLVHSIEEIVSSPFVYDFSTDSSEELFVAGTGGIQNHNTYYGYLAGDGARFRSFEVTGLTTAIGKEIIGFGTEVCDPIAINLELDSLDYKERIIMLDPENKVQIVAIGDFVDRFLQVKDASYQHDLIKNVEKSDVTGWKALSVTKDGKYEWQSITTAIRQKTMRDIYKIKTPFGDISTTDSHSIFIHTNNQIEPVEVKNLKSEYIAHLSQFTYNSSIIPQINLAIASNLSKIFDMFVFVPVLSQYTRYNSYKVTKVRSAPYINKRTCYYSVPLSEFKESPQSDMLIGSIKGHKFPAIIDITPEIAELCGWYVSEGTSGIYNGKISVGITQQNKENLDRIEYLINNIGKLSLGGYIAHCTLSDKRTQTFRIGMDNQFFYQLFTILGCGHNAFEKRIPTLILSASREIQERFLLAYLKGDGNRPTGDTRWRADTVSDGLRDDLFVLGNFLNYIISNQDYSSTTSGNTVYIINFMQKENWKVGSDNHYSHTELNNVIGLQKLEMKLHKKTTDYVYDISVAKNNNFVCAHGGIIAHNTDGLWTVLPSVLPMTTGYSYSMVDAETNEPIRDSENAILYQDAKDREFINLFNDVFNREVEAKFINNNNYLPCAADGKLYNYGGKEWNPKEDQSKRENKPIDYEHDPDYFDQWVQDPHWIPKPQNFIEFEYDGGTTGFYAMYLKGKKMYQTWSEDDEGVPEVEETKGIITKRKDGLNLMKQTCDNMFEKMIVQKNIEDVWKFACNDVINKYYQQIKDHTLPPQLIEQSKDLTGSEADVRNAYRQHRDAISEYKLNEEDFHATSGYITSKYNSPKFSGLYSLYCSKGGILDAIKSPYTMTGFRSIDMGLSISTVSWVIIKYPIEKSKSAKSKEPTKADVSERAIPLALLGSPDADIRKYIYRWTGHKMAENETAMDLIDWDEYLAMYEQFIRLYVIKPSKNQVDVSQWLQMKYLEKKKEKGIRIDSFFSNTPKDLKKAQVSEPTQDQPKNPPIEIKAIETITPVKKSTNPLDAFFQFKKKQQ